MVKIRPRKIRQLMDIKQKPTLLGVDAAGDAAAAAGVVVHRHCLTRVCLIAAAGVVV
jgi:hypothetical protein